MRAKTTNEILETYRRGDYLDDTELEILRAKMQQIVDALSGFGGDLFVLQRNYARHVLDDCRAFQASRRERRKPSEEK